ncbi:MAG: hypothetical protein KAS01_00635 [Candidatus Pacebacteria bacterium]|nr:hypothetical protein [Candidatus Paceibacterota bacterium]
MKKKIILIIFFAFLFFTIFYKWQISTSNLYLLQGDKNYNTENYSEALKNYKYVTVIDGNRDVIYEAKIKRAKIFFEHGDLEKSKQELYKAIEEKRSNSIAYELMGDIYYAKRNINSAIIYYNKAGQIKNSKEIEIKLGKSFIAINEKKKAYDIFLQLSLNSTDSEVLYYLGFLDFYNNIEYNSFFQQIEKESSNYEFELKTIKAFSENCCNTKNERYKNILVADLYNKINQPYLAISKIEENSESNFNYRDAWIILGKANYILGNYESSYNNFQKAFDADSHNSEISFWLKSSFEKMKGK